MVDRQIEVYTGPRGSTYRSRAIFYKPGKSIPLTLGAKARRIRVNEILPPVKATCSE
jgi:hypothetical protein